MNNTICLIAGSSHPMLAERVSDELGIPLTETEMEYFSNTEIRPRIKQPVRGKDVFLIQTGAWTNERSVNDFLMEVILTAKTCKRSDAKSVSLLLPFFPYSRQDKKDIPRACISAKDIADIIEVSGINRVLTFDLHAPQIQGFFNIPCDNLTTEHLIAQWLQHNLFKNANTQKENHILIAPDENAIKQTKHAATMLELPFLALSKQRDYTKKNEVEETVLIGDKKQLEGKTAIIIDDMIDTCGTMVAACDILEKNGAKEVIVAVTHGVLSGPAIDRIEQTAAIKSVLISDTLPQQHHKKQSKKIEVFSVAPMIANAVTRLHTSKSIGEMLP